MGREGTTRAIALILGLAVLSLPPVAAAGDYRDTGFGGRLSPTRCGR